MLEKRSKPKFPITKMILSFALGILLGITVSLIKIGDRSWVPAAIDKGKQLAGISKSYSDDIILPVTSSRYQLNPIYQISKVGTMQLAYDKSADKIYAVERYSGDFYSLDLSGKLHLQLISNLYDYLSLNQIRHPNELPLAMDLHISDGFIYLSVVIPGLQNKCERLSLYKLDFSDENLGTKKLENEKKPLFQTPCIRDRENSLMWGGRITSSKLSVFLSVGEQRFDRSGFPKSSIMSESEISNTKSFFGKILEISKNDDRVRIFSSGHRNAQGLYFSPEDNLLFESEHGPNGGDEINILRRGENYGWPYVTFGKPYPKKYPSGEDERNNANDPALGVDMDLGKFGAKSGSHFDYNYPLFSWSPGSGAGNLVKISKSSILTEWQGNLLVALMGQEAFLRVILGPANEVVFTELIELQFRIRDFVVTQNGLIILSTDDGRFLVLSTYDSKLNQSS